MPRFLQILCIVLFSGAFLAFGVDRAEAETALASWYGPGFAGQPTASGDVYDPSGYTAAHKTLPLGTQLIVSYRGNSVPVTVNDRGPYVGGRELDLSQGAAEAIGLTQAGVDYVDYYVAGSSGGGYAGSGGVSYQQESYAPSYSQAADGGTASGGVYTVQQGDTLYEIAGQLGTSVEYLASVNGLADPDVLYVGQTISY